MDIGQARNTARPAQVALQPAVEVHQRPRTSPNEERRLGPHAVLDSGRSTEPDTAFGSGWSTAFDTERHSELHAVLDSGLNTELDAEFRSEPHTGLNSERRTAHGPARDP